MAMSRPALSCCCGWCTTWPAATAPAGAPHSCWTPPTSTYSQSVSAEMATPPASMRAVWPVCTLGVISSGRTALRVMYHACFQDRIRHTLLKGQLLPPQRVEQGSLLTCRLFLTTKGVMSALLSPGGSEP